MAEKRTRKKEEVKKEEAKAEAKAELIVTDDTKILKQLAEQSLILVTQFDTIEKKLDKTIEILDKLLKLKKHEMGIYE